MKTIIAGFFLLCSLLLSLAAVENPGLTLAKTIGLAGVKGRFDHFAIDTNSHRLFVAALGNNTVEVIDIQAGRRLKSIAGLHKPTGVLYLSPNNQLGIDRVRVRRYIAPATVRYGIADKTEIFGRVPLGVAEVL